MKSPKALSKLRAAARKTQKNSYSPYSKCKVGAAVVDEKGRVFSGTNVENASFGGTVCAERVAVWKAISEGATQITGVYVVGPQKEIWPPCGLCRQVLAEFCQPKTQVVCANPRGDEKLFSFEELLPEAFGPDFLKS